ncbi:MAG: chemoreceptor glutamine deamidase CheD [Sulfuritalea sp.]|nr:chemoreceptor glutamine deamidase CheD [Sulfuritalea sp.]MDP1983483.1 chemoreceptor glutamine deamidase CheD [Sulfuritalea sp.]
MNAEFAEQLAGNRYFDPIFGIDAVKVLPGEYFVTAADMVLVTVLGSCVSACIRDRESGIGGMNHFMLADCAEQSRYSASARYGIYAMEILINHLLKLGARRDSLEAKVFGGGRVMASLVSSNVGERNSAFVLDFLHTEGIFVAARDLLDNHPRKVYFFPATGKVLVKTLLRLHNDTVQRREIEYAARLAKTPIAGAIELF